MSASVAAESAVATRSSWRVTLSTAWQLARVEGLRFVRHPLLIATSLVGAALLVVGTWTVAPVLNRHDEMTVDALIPLAGAILIVAHLAVSRSVRHGTTEIYDSAPARVDVVTVGHLLSIGWAFGVALCVVLAELAYMKAVGGVGIPRLPVVFTGPALVALGAAFGVALGRYFPHPLAGPVALIAMVAVVSSLLNTGSLGPRDIADSFSPYVPGNQWESGLEELSMRPLWALLGYVFSLAFAVCIIALLHKNRRLPLIALLCLALVTSAVFVERRSRRPTRAQQFALAAPFFEPEKHRDCEVHAGVRYCSYPAYVPWIDKWASVVGSVLAGAPDGAQPAGLEVTQLPTSDQLFESDYARRAGIRFDRLVRRGALARLQEIHPGLAWGRNETEGKFELGLALKVAERVTGIDSDFVLTENDLQAMPRRAQSIFGKGRVTGCAVFGQGRSIVAMWLAAQATPRARVALFDTFVPVDWDSPYQILLEEYQAQVFGYSAPGIVYWGTREAEYTRELLRRDEAEVRAIVSRNWTHLTKPSTTSEQAAAILGLSVLKRAVSGGRQALSFGAPLCR